MLFRNCLVVFAFLIPSLIVTLAEDDVEDNSVAHGLGEHYDWVPISEGFRVAQELNKPVMLIIHKSWCGACRSLKPKIANSQKMLDKSKDFVMINAMDDEEPAGELYRPGGAAYVPRILFFSNLGEPMEDIINERGNTEYPYFYFDEEGIIASMSKCLARMDGANIVDEGVQNELDEGVQSEHIEL